MGKEKRHISQYTRIKGGKKEAVSEHDKYVFTKPQLSNHQVKTIVKGKSRKLFSNFKEEDILSQDSMYSAYFGDVDTIILKNGNVFYTANSKEMMERFLDQMFFYLEPESFADLWVDYVDFEDLLEEDYKLMPSSSNNIDEPVNIFEYYGFEPDEFKSMTDQMRKEKAERIVSLLEKEYGKKEANMILRKYVDYKDIIDDLTYKKDNKIIFKFEYGPRLIDQEDGSYWVVTGKDADLLGRWKSKEEAEKHLREIILKI